jgi:hypothetical protein
VRASSVNEPSLRRSTVETRPVRVGVLDDDVREPFGVDGLELERLGWEVAGLVAGPGGVAPAHAGGIPFDRAPERDGAVDGEEDAQPAAETPSTATRAGRSRGRRSMRAATAATTASRSAVT